MRAAGVDFAELQRLYVEPLASHHIEWEEGEEEEESSLSDVEARALDDENVTGFLSELLAVDEERASMGGGGFIDFSLAVGVPH